MHSCRRPDRGILIATACLLVAGCVSPAARTEVRTPTVPSVARGMALHLRGVAGGPMPGLGGRAEVEVWLRDDGIARAEFRGEREEGQGFHEVLLWGEDFAYLMDRRSGRSLDSLGATAGGVEVLGVEFRVAELYWMIAGLWPETTEPPVWTQRRSQWRGRVPGRGLRLPRGPRAPWRELIWRDEAAQVHDLRVQTADWREIRALAVPARLAVDGRDLEGRVRVEWTQIDEVPASDDLLDPLWEPSTR